MICIKQYKFSDADVKKLIKQIVILIDTREKKNSHITDYFTKHGIAYEPTTLSYGDYSFMLPSAAAGEDIFFHRDIAIERKGSLEELSGNLAQERERFEREFLKAGNDGAKLYLMVEDVGGYTSIISHKYNTQLAPAAYMASLKAWETRFNCNVQFIDKQYSGYYIMSTFQYYAREMLK